MHPFESLFVTWRAKHTPRELTIYRRIPTEFYAFRRTVVHDAQAAAVDIEDVRRLLSGFNPPDDITFIADCGEGIAMFSILNGKRWTPSFCPCEEAAARARWEGVQE